MTNRLVTALFLGTKRCLGSKAQNKSNSFTLQRATGIADNADQQQRVRTFASSLCLAQQAGTSVQVLARSYASASRTKQSSQGASERLHLISTALEHHLGMDRGVINGWTPATKATLAKSRPGSIAICLARHMQHFPTAILQSWFHKQPLLLLYHPDSLQSKLDMLGRELRLTTDSVLKLTCKGPGILSCAEETLTDRIMTIDSLHKQGRSVTAQVVRKSANILQYAASAVRSRFAASMTYFGMQESDMVGKVSNLTDFMKISSQDLHNMVHARARIFGRTEDCVKQIVRANPRLISTSTQLLTDKHTFLSSIVVNNPAWVKQFHSYSPSILADIYADSWFALLRLQYLVEMELVDRVCLERATRRRVVVSLISDGKHKDYTAWLQDALPNLQIPEKYKDELARKLKKETASA